MEIIHTEQAPAAIGPYSQGYIMGGIVYTSGQIPVDPKTGAVPEGIAAQAEQSCKSVAAPRGAAGARRGAGGEAPWARARQYEAFPAGALFRVLTAHVMRRFCKKRTDFLSAKQIVCIA